LPVYERTDNEIGDFMASYLIFQIFENFDYIEQNRVFDFLRIMVMVNLHTQKNFFFANSSKTK
jgi:hypothetical protein